MGTENNLTRLREQRGLSQREVANELGITRQAVSHWEAGKAFPSMEKQLALSRLYGVPVEKLYQDDAVQEMGVTEEAIPAEAPPEAAGPETGPLHKYKWGVIAVLVVCVYFGTFLWGRLTNSRAAAVGYLIWETIFLGLGLLIRFIWRNRKK